MGFSLIYVCFVTHILSLNPWTFFILIGCCTYYDNLSTEKNCSEPKVRRQGHLVLNSFLYLMRPKRYWERIPDMWISPINARRNIKKCLARSVQNLRTCQRSNDCWISPKKTGTVNNVDLRWSVSVKSSYAMN